MRLLFEIINLAKDIIQGNIWIGTIFWISLGIFLTWMASWSWEIYKEETGRTKVLMFFLWVISIVEIAAVTVAGFVK